ncbi:MAG: hypothetical protein IJR16_06070, partial [Spirochaetales bacterium]|nr:hypothetical protein [Spirochaetales bacterium]
YDIRTKEMHPCFRCQKVLGLSKLVTNYPEPAIEMCIFPDWEQYKEIMGRVDKGESVDVVLPLTKERIPYRVRYDVETDAEGRPAFAYGTAIPAKESEL